MIKNLANREAQHGITCNAVSPAMIESTGMIPKHTMAADDMSRQIASQIPLGRLGQPDEIASSTSRSRMSTLTDSLHDARGERLHDRRGRGL